MACITNKALRGRSDHKLSVQCSDYKTESILGTNMKIVLRMMQARIASLMSTLQDPCPFVTWTLEICLQPRAS